MALPPTLAGSGSRPAGGSAATARGGPGNAGFAGAGPPPPPPRPGARAGATMTGSVIGASGSSPAATAKPGAALTTVGASTADMRRNLHLRGSRDDRTAARPPPLPPPPPPPGPGPGIAGRAESSSVLVLFAGVSVGCRRLLVVGDLAERRLRPRVDCGRVWFGGSGSVGGSRLRRVGFGESCVGWSPLGSGRPRCRRPSSALGFSAAAVVVAVARSAWVSPPFVALLPSSRSSPSPAFSPRLAVVAAGIGLRRLHRNRLRSCHRGQGEASHERSRPAPHSNVWHRDLPGEAGDRQRPKRRRDHTRTGRRPRSRPTLRFAHAYPLVTTPHGNARRHYSLIRRLLHRDSRWFAVDINLLALGAHRCGNCLGR